MKNQPTNDWHFTENELPVERKEVITRNADGWGSYSKETILRRKGEFWFFSDWTQKTYYVPTQWKYAN